MSAPTTEPESEPTGFADRRAATARAELVRRLGHRVRALAPRRSDLTEMRRSPGRDLLAGLTVGVVALPLALGFGISSGMGAAAGLVTAVVAGTVAALFGGSHVQVSGPTGAMTVVLVPIVAQHGPDGVLVVGLMAGALLVGMALTGVGRHVRLVPLPVVEGFTLGIAVIIGLQQAPAALGVPSEGEVLPAALSAVGEWASRPSWPAPSIACAVVATIMITSRWRPAVPGALLAVTAATVVAQVANLPVARIGALPAGLPAPALPGLDLGDLQPLVAPAVAVAALAALESLLSATVADAMSVSGRHDPDRELFGQGLANIAAPVFGGVPATAAIARTAVNVRSGARSRLAALTHALVLLVVVVTLAPLVERIPLAALAGVLIATAARMVEVSGLRALMGVTRGDALVLVVTFLATVVLDLVTAVILGIVVAGGSALRQVARTTALREVPLGALPQHAAATGSDDRTAAEEQALLHDHVVAYRLEGPLFFGGAHSALLQLAELSDVRVVVLRMSHVTTLDATAAALLADAIRRLEGHGVIVLVSGLPPRFHRVLDVTGIRGHLEARGHLFEHTPDAIAHARRHLAPAGRTHSP